ncbi:hypothetical protein [Streptomyces sp. NPDC055134]
MLTLGDRVDRCRFFVRDRDGKFSDAFDAVLAGAGVQVLLSPPRLLDGLISEYEHTA